MINSELVEYSAVLLSDLWFRYLTHTVNVIEYYSTLGYKEGNKP